jgi:hypothetical protein
MIILIIAFATYLSIGIIITISKLMMDSQFPAEDQPAYCLNHDYKFVVVYILLWPLILKYFKTEVRSYFSDSGKVKRKFKQSQIMATKAIMGKLRDKSKGIKRY